MLGCVLGGVVGHLPSHLLKKVVRHSGKSEHSSAAVRVVPLSVTVWSQLRILHVKTLQDLVAQLGHLLTAHRRPVAETVVVVCCQKMSVECSQR